MSDRDPIYQDDLHTSEMIQKFSELLDEINNLSDKKKSLWKEIYKHAIEDRYNAFIMYDQLFKIVKNSATEHAVHDRNIATFLERMSKSNDQVIKLAELIAAAEKKSDQIDPDDLYEQIAAAGLVDQNNKKRKS